MKIKQFATISIDRDGEFWIAKPAEKLTVSVVNQRDIHSDAENILSETAFSPRIQNSY